MIIFKIGSYNNFPTLRGNRMKNSRLKTLRKTVANPSDQEMTDRMKVFNHHTINNLLRITHTHNHNREPAGYSKNLKGKPGRWSLSLPCWALVSARLTIVLHVDDRTRLIREDNQS